MTMGQREVGPPRRRALLVSLLSLTATLAAASEPGAVLRVESTALGDEAAVTEVGAARVQGLLLSMDLVTGEDGAPRRHSLIFDGEAKKLTSIDHQQKSYVEMTLETMKSMMAGVNQQLQAALKEMESELARLPPDRRRQIEAMMKQQLEVGAAVESESDSETAKGPATVVRKTELADTIAGQRCRRYDVFSGETKLREVWVADWQSVGLPSDLFKVFAALGEFFTEMTASLPAGGLAALESNPFVALDQLAGFPMLVTSFAEGKPERETRLRVVERRQLDADVFSPPPGYRKVEPFRAR